VLVSRWDAGPLHPGRQRGGCGCRSGGGRSIVLMCDPWCGARFPAPRDRAATVVAARISCAVQPFLWYCLGVGRVSSSFFSAALIDLAPLPGGAFSAISLALCNHLSYCIGGFAGRRNSASPPRLSPAAAGLFPAGPPRSAQPTARLGVEVVGLLRFGGTVRALYGKTQRWTHLAPSPLAGLLFVCAASECRHRNQCASTSFEWWA
jgi:hypothetical protein